MVKLGDICRVLNGYAFKSDLYVDNGIRVIRIANVQKGYIEDSSPVYYSEKDPNANKYTLFENDLLISLTGNVGRVGMMTKEFLPAALNQRVACLRINNESLIDIKYLYHYLNSDSFERHCIEASNGVAQKNLSTEWLKEYPINVPAIEIQHIVVLLLDKIDYLITLYETQLTKLDELVKARFVEMFGGEGNPMGWKIIKLAELCNLQNGYAFKSDDYVEKSDVLNCRMSNIRPDGGFDSDYHPKYLPEEYWKKFKNYRLYDGDVIIAMTDMASDPKILGVPTIVKTNSQKFLLNQRVGKLLFFDKDRINRIYLMSYLSQLYIRKNLTRSAGGSTQINIGKPAVLNIEVFDPPIKLQNEFAQFAKQIDKAKELVLRGLDKLETLKKALMQEYFG